MIKTMRREMRLSREDLADQLFISVRQLARIEAGEATVSMWQFVSMLELLGNPTEDFWLLYLDSSEYSSYREYRRLKRQLKNGDMSDAAEIITEIESGTLIKQPLIKQFVEYAKIAIGVTMPTAETLSGLLRVMHISKPKFEEGRISEYRMTHNEISIATFMAQCYVHMGESDRGIAMMQALIVGRERAQVSEEDRAILFPGLYYTLSRMLLNADRFKEALKACEAALESCREYNNMHNIPQILFDMGHCYYKLGEEEHMYRTHLVRAYHAAYAMGRNESAKMIKDDALEYFNVDVI